MNTRHFARPSFARIASASLLGGASFLSLVTAAQAQQVVFSSTPEIPVGTIQAGRDFALAGSTVQIKLPGGGMASFVGTAQFSIRPDGGIDLRSGSVTVVAGRSGEAVVHMPEGVRGTVASGGTGSFTANASGARGSTAAGMVSVTANGVTKPFGMGQFWTASGTSAPDRVIAGTAAIVPGTATDTGPVQPLREGGIVAAAENGIPIALGEALAGVGARGDIVAAAQRLEAYDANPTIAAFPTGDYALLVQYAAQANGLLGAGGTTFNGAGADIIRTYFEYLAAGNSGPAFRTAYAGILLNYLDLVRSGVLPSSFRGATQTQLNAYLAFIGRTDGFGGLSATNRQLLDAYLAFLQTGGQPDAFGTNVTGLTAAFLNFVRGGGNPATFSQASATVVAQYLAIVNSGGLRTNLTAQNQALLAAYLANNGVGFTTSYATGLAAFVAFLNTGGLPSGYSALPPATIRAYLETLETTGLFDSVLGTQSAFLRTYLTFLRTGGTPDQFNALPINVARVNASALNIYVDYLLSGGLPSTYTTLTAAQIRAALDQLTATGQFNALLGANAAFLGEYYAYLRTGADADTFAGLPSVDVNAYASALTVFATYLRAGNLPSGYTTLTAQQIRNYLTALQVGGKLTLLGSDATLLGDYLLYLRTGGAPDQFAGLPIVTYQSYASALSLYFAYLNGGGLPTGYAALTQAQLRTYLDVLRANGQFALLGANATFYTDYLAFLAGGGSPDAYAALPIVTFRSYATALTAYFAYLNGGGLPSGYTALTQAQVRQYLDALRASNQLTALLGANASFYSAYLTYLAGGGAPDQFSGLPIVTFQGYATALAAYYAFLLNGGAPTAYTALTQAQIREYLDALKTSGQLAALLGANAAFFDNYLAFLATGGNANAYPGLPSSTYGQYAAALSAYFAYLNGGGLPSGYTALTAAQVREYLDVLRANNQLAALLGSNAGFFEAYLTFVAGGGSPDAFTGLPIVTFRSYASALTAYYAFLAGGGLPAGYTALTQAQIRQYLDALQASGQLTALLGTNATFFSNYLTFLAGGGVPGEFPGLPSSTYGQYASALSAYFAYLNAGGLPSGYTALTAAQIREYLDILRANNQLTALFGTNAAFFEAYLTFVAGGGSPDAFTGLPIVTFRSYASALTAYYAFLAGGGLPANYTQLTQAQIRQYLDALQASGQLTALLGVNATFFSTYLTYLAGGGAPDAFTGLPATTYASYGTSIATFVAFLRGNGLPGSYTALTATQLREFLAVLTANGQLGRIGNAADIALVNAYAAYLAGGGVPNQFAGLPAFVTYEASLRTYYAFILGGGRPSAYTALTQAQIVAYIQALDAAGLVASKLSAEEAAFLRSYASFVGGGGNADQFAGLPGNQPIGVPVVTQGLANAPRSTATTKVAMAAAGHVVFSPATTAASITLDGNAVRAADTVTGGTVTAVTAKTLEARTVDGTIAIARIGDGSYQAGGSTYSATTNQGVHFVWGTPATALPAGSGIVTYGLVTATAPTADPNVLVAAGTFTGNFAVDLVGRRVGWDSVIAIGTDSYALKSSGGLTAPSVALSNALNFAVTGQQVAGAQQAYVSGFLAGSNGAYAGLAYQLLGTSYNQVSGAAIFGRGAPLVTLPTTPTPPTSLPAPSYPYAAGLPTSQLTLLAIRPGTTPASSTIQNQGGATVTRDANGGLISSTNPGAVQNLARTTAKVTDIFGDSRAAIGRWFDGGFTIQGTNTLSASQSLHYVQMAGGNLVLPTTGQVNYSLLAATQPTYTTGLIGAGLFDAKMAVLFGTTSRVAIEGTIRMPEPSGTVTYSFATPGGVAGVAQRNAFGLTREPFSLTAPLTGSGIACATTCFFNFTAGFAGTDANRIGAVYYTSDATRLNVPQINGAAIFTGTPVSGGPSNIVPMPVQPTYRYAGGFSGTVRAYVNGESDVANNTYGASGGSVNLSSTTEASGGVVSFGGGAIGTYARGTAQQADVAGDGILLIGRWVGGTQTVGNVARTFGANDSMHYALLAPATLTLPTTGTIRYSLIGATQPTIYGGGTTTAAGQVAAGVFDATLGITFGAAPRVGIEGSIFMPEVAAGAVKYTFATTGGSAAPGLSQTNIGRFQGGVIDIDTPLVGPGLACPSGATNCRITFLGQMGGPNASRVGLTYSTFSTGGAPIISGAAAFGAVGTESQSSLVQQNVQVLANGLRVDSGDYLATYDGDRLVSYQSTGGNTVAAGIVQESGRLAQTVGWARWTGDTAGPVTNQGPNAGAHVLFGTETSFNSMPSTGTVQYTLAGSTKPTLSNGSAAPGTITGTLGVAFGAVTSRVGFDLTATVGDYGWRMQTNGGSANPGNGLVVSATDRSFNGSLSKGTMLTGTTPLSCVGTCTANINGNLYGTGASHVGLGFGISDGALRANGVAVFAQAPTGSGGGGTGPTGTFTGQTTYAYAGGTLVDQGVTTATYANNVVNGYASFLTGTAKAATVIQERGRLAETIGWARWTGDTAGPLNNQLATAGVHVMSGTPTAVATLPATGTVAYTMVGGTNPTLTQGGPSGAVLASPGTITGSLAVAYGGGLPRVAMDLTATVGSYGWRVQTPGGIANAAQSQMTVGAQATFGQTFTKQIGVTPTTATSCTVTCSATIGGQLYGTGGSHIGLAFNMLDGSATSSGIAVFARP